MLVYRAIQSELVGKLMQMSAEEKMVFQQIREAGNEGIWTKIIKTKTGVHSMVLQRCLKSLESKALVKSVKSVKVICWHNRQNPTRKLYMLLELTPSAEVTGGPWFTDQELDLDFIETLSKQCYRYIYSRVSYLVLKTELP